MCAGLFLSTFSHSSLPAAVSEQYFSFLKYPLTELQLVLRIRSALVSDGSLLEPCGTGSYLAGGSFCTLLTEATPAAPLLPNHCHVNPIQAAVLQKACCSREKKARHHTARCERPKVGFKSYPSVSVGSGDGEWSLKYFSKAVAHVAGQRTSSSRGMWRCVERPGYLHEQQLPRVGSDWSPTR